MDVASTPDSKKTESFPLFSLPDELVLRILGFSVITSSKEDPIRVEEQNVKAVAQPAIIQTCRMLRNEGLKLFYSGNVFQATSGPQQMETFWPWIDAIGTQNLCLIKEIQMVYADYDGQALAPILMSWHDWEAEMEFLTDSDQLGVHARHPLYVRMHCSKVVLGPGMTYHLSFSKKWQDPAEWTSIAELRDTIEAMPYETFRDTDTIMPTEGLALSDLSE